MPDDPRYLRPGQVAKRFGVTNKTVAAWADKGLIAAIVLPSGQRRILRSSVQAFEVSLAKEGTSHD